MAIDWIGSRYRHGWELYHCLWVQSKAIPDNVDWDDEKDITFSVPENVAWKIRDIGEECQYRWDCFSINLASHLSHFCENIV